MTIRTYYEDFLLQMSTLNNKRSIYTKLTELEDKLDETLASDTKLITLELIHRYNEVKDAAQVVMQHIANLEGTSLAEVHQRLGLED